MIDSVLGFAPNNKQSFYFMLLVDKITLNQPTLSNQPHNIKFMLFKGPQIFNQNKEPIPFSFSSSNTLKVDKVQLTFFLKEYNPNRKNDFSFKLRQVSGDGEQTEIISHSIFANDYIRALKQNSEPVVEETIEAGPYSVTYKVVTDKNRYDLEKLVKNMKQCSTTQQQKENLEVNQPKGDDKKEEKKGQKYSNKDFQLNIKRNIRDIKNREGPKQQKKPIQPQAPMSPKSPDLGALNTISKAKHSMANSIKLQKSEIVAQPANPENPINIKIIIFLLVSLVAIFFAMTPTRRAPGKKSDHL